MWPFKHNCSRKGHRWAVHTWPVPPYPAGVSGPLAGGEACIECGCTRGLWGQLDMAAQFGGLQRTGDP